MQAAAARASVKNMAPRQTAVPPAAVQMFQYRKEGLNEGAPPALRAKVANERDPKVKRAAESWSRSRGKKVSACFRWSSKASQY